VLSHALARALAVVYVGAFRRAFGRGGVDDALAIEKRGLLKVNETHAIAELVQLVAVADVNPSSTFLEEVWRPAVTQINASPNRDGSCGGGVRRLRPEETEEVKQFRSVFRCVCNFISRFCMEGFSLFRSRFI
jgi:hypothetical protein